ncbi:alanine--tRNA ligase [Siminovitchia fortis]|uniref:Alanine--tRNA ligase n=1 Tax=Siminovitchia fortis TaxID=254758 RepID=A0A443J423_9BACI|nr:alanine--tRNA ligase [Siminovitchia fortis]RWR15200.1 alanine--tRNA ligase [Siminovitchia fortis]WHY82659.1 alanine--tRNA ligase [Siminovitchia fortis]
MKKLTGSQIRQMFLDFFQEKGHKVEPSASLIPHDDPSLLWINSGVATLKKYFDGREIPENPRIVNAQKSIRTNDIENVGKTARHHTFFEMLGNFSIGDYFKKEAIEWAWEFLTSEKWIGFDPEKLSVTIHPEDDEAFELWNQMIGMPKERIIRLKENFWDIGEGPSGPNSEIFFDRGPEYGDDPNDPELFPGGENERYLEIWNLVFSQFNHNPDGTYTPLPKKNIDTGMGLERMASVVQDVPTNFETDLFMPIIKETEKLSGKAYGESTEQDTAFKVIADHVRTVVFAVSDGALPSNEGRGYVLRRLLRRAVRYGKNLKIEKPFMYRLVPVVGEIMKDFYPKVLENTDFIERVIKNEEERFHETLNDGLEILSSLIERAKAEGKDMISGKDVFRLYDTYGFPVELTEEYAEEEQMKVDHDGFAKEMEKQRERARSARSETDSMQVQSGTLSELTVSSEFVGYEHLETDSVVLAILKEGDITETVEKGDEIQFILDVTPFYAESGGQVADHGIVSGPSQKIEVTKVIKAPNGQNLHTGVVKEGTIKTGNKVKAKVDEKMRGQIIKNHTATHLLHKALKDVLGTHVNQAGSYVGPERLRFDFSHFGSVTDEELKKVEEKVNRDIWANHPVDTKLTSLAEAKEMGAMALFGEKYGETVRVVSAGDSLELCGGCHVSNTAEIGLFKIVAESGIGAGVRRIEAVTGEHAFRFMNGQVNELHAVAEKLKTKPAQAVERTEALLLELKELQRENESLTAKLAHVEAGSLIQKAKEIEGIKVIVSQVQDADMNTLRNMGDDLKQQLGSGIVVLGSVQNGKVNIIAGVTKDLMEKGYHAGKLVKEVASRCGGGGGGRPDMAQAGGKNPDQLESALSFVGEWIKSV